MVKKPKEPENIAPVEPLLHLINEIRDLVQQAHLTAAHTVNTLQVATNFEIGRRIVEHEQSGSCRAGYGKRLLVELSQKLTDEFGKGFSSTNLKNMRQFYLEYREQVRQISQTASYKFGVAP